MNNEIKTGTMLKPTILSIALLTIMAAAAISPALGKISQAFPEANRTTIKLILTLPCLVIIPFSLLSGWLVSRVGKKPIVIIGLIIYLLGGVAGGLANGITQLLIIRGLFGVGVGLVMPLSTTLIADFFSGPARTKMMGLYSTSTSLGGVIFQVLSGWLAVMSWRYSFGVYGLALVSIIFTLLWLPEPKKVIPKKGTSTKIILPKGVYVIALLGTLMMIAFFAIPTNLALFIDSEEQMFSSEEPLFKDKAELLHHLEQGTISETTQEAFKAQGISISINATIKKDEVEEGKWIVNDNNKDYIIKKIDDKLVIYKGRLGRPALAGYALSALTLSSASSSMILSTIFSVFGVFSVFLAILLMCIGFILLSQASALWMVFIASICIGLGAGIMMPKLLLNTQKIVKANARALAMAVISSAIYFGQFISPVLLKAIATLFGNDTFRFRFTILAIGLAIATIISLFLAIKSKMSKSTDTIPKEN